MTQSKIPEELEEIGINDLLEEDGWVYTLPWAVYADKSGRVWINGKYPFGTEPAGTLNLKIRRNGKEIQVGKAGLGKISRSGDCFVGGAIAMPVELV